MATYTELYGLKNDPIVRQPLIAAIAEKGRLILADGTAGTPQKNWARDAFENPEGKALNVVWPLLVQNKDTTVANILAVCAAANDGGAQSDVLQGNVNTAIDSIIEDLT